MRMLSLSAFALLMSGVVSAAEDKEFIRCQSNLVEEYVVEVDSNVAAFFDNDTWTLGPLVYQSEGTPAVDVYSAGSFDGFLLEISYSDLSDRISGTLYINVDNAEEKHSLSCEKVKGQSYIDTL